MSKYYQLESKKEKSIQKKKRENIKKIKKKNEIVYLRKYANWYFL
tara:strand:- start:1015 stop:1149 length:135 start_codon:yes stop_codon:yes gene_type:complete